MTIPGSHRARVIEAIKYSQPPNKPLEVFNAKTLASRLDLTVVQIGNCLSNLSRRRLITKVGSSDRYYDYVPTRQLLNAKVSIPGRSRPKPVRDNLPQYCNHLPNYLATKILRAVESAVAREVRREILLRASYACATQLSLFGDGTSR